MTGFYKLLEPSHRSVSLLSLNITGDTALSLDILNSLQVAHTSLEAECDLVCFGSASSQGVQRNLTRYTCRESIELETCWEYHLSPEKPTSSDPDYDGVYSGQSRIEEVESDHSDKSDSQISEAIVDDIQTAAEYLNSSDLSHGMLSIATHSSSTALTPSKQRSAQSSVSWDNKLADITLLSPRKTLCDVHNTLDVAKSSTGRRVSCDCIDTDTNLNFAHREDSEISNAPQICLNSQDDVFFPVRSPGLKRKREKCINSAFMNNTDFECDEDATLSTDTCSEVSKKRVRAVDRAESFGSQYFDSPSTRQCSPTITPPFCVQEEQMSSRSSFSTRIGSPVVIKTMSPVPVIAPPEYRLIPPAPFSVEDAADARIRILLTREKTSLTQTSYVGETDYNLTTGEECLASEKEFLKEVAQWLLDARNSTCLKCTSI